MSQPKWVLVHPDTLSWAAMRAGVWSPGARGVRAGWEPGLILLEIRGRQEGINTVVDSDGAGHHADCR